MKHVESHWGGENPEIVNININQMAIKQLNLLQEIVNLQKAKIKLKNLEFLWNWGNMCHLVTKRWLINDFFDAMPT